MKRRDVAGVLFASAATSALLSPPAQAQACSAPCYPRTAAETAAGLTPVNLGFPPGHAYRWGSPDPSGATSASTAIQNAITSCWMTGENCYVPSGRYQVSGLVMPPNTPAGYDYRGDAFKLYGAGAGPAFAIAIHKNTVFFGTSNAPILRYAQHLGPVTSSGHYYIEGIRFEGNSTFPVILLEVFGEYSRLRDCEIFQAGTGDGIRLHEGTKGTIENCNILNADWNTPGAVARTGVGINVFSQYNAGLLTIRKVTSRGFAYGFVIGDGSHDLSAVLLQDCECSVVTTGIFVANGISKCKIDHCYFEGVTGTCVTDRGRYTVVRDCFMYTGFSIGIDGGTSTYGNVYDANYLEMGTNSPCTLITVDSSGANGGPGKSVTNNHLLWASSGGGIPNMVGLEISGIEPRVDFSGNSFLPRGEWIGGAGTFKIRDISTGGGVFGLGVADDRGREFPLLSRGAIALGKGAAVLGNSAIAAGTLTLGRGSYFELACTSLVVITALSPGGPDGKVYVVRTSTANGRFTSSSAMKLSGGVMFSGPGIIEFIVDNGVAYERSRTVY